MLRQGANPCVRTASARQMEIERQHSYIPWDDRDGGANPGAVLGAGRCVNSDRFRLIKVPEYMLAFGRLQAYSCRNVLQAGEK